MIFNKRITIYMNQRHVTTEELADLAVANADAHGLDNQWVIEAADGHFDRKCQCGSADCTDKPEVQ